MDDVSVDDFLFCNRFCLETGSEMEELWKCSRKGKLSSGGLANRWSR
jgi:hypothetical protein